MFRRSWYGFLLSLVFVLFTYSSAVADTPVFNSKDGKFYGSINAGIFILNDMDFGANLTAYGSTVTAAGSVSFNEGASIGGALGYVINDKVRTELELGYQSVRTDKITLTADITNSAGATSTYDGAYDINGQIDSLAVLTNVIFTPLGNKTLFGMSITPLIGGGIGFVDWETTVNSVDAQAVNGKEDDTDFLASIMTGLEYTSSQQLTWAIKYKHMWADTGDKGVDDTEADSIVANLKIAF
jgi:opacity protein-like surface antigen